MEKTKEYRELTVADIKTAADKIRKALKEENSRLKSWEYCYKIFGEKRNKTDAEMYNETVDLLSLHLGFYLASWGMYRGSSFLLQKDYKVHNEAVEMLLNKKYDSLRGASLEDLKKDETLTLLFELKSELNEIYSKEKPKNAKEGVTDTLLSKIIMGVFGCCPAYDENVTTCLKQYGISAASFSKKSVLSLIKFFEEHKDIKSVVNEECKKINSEAGLSEVEYPQMKVIDSILWQLGKN